MAEYVSFMRRLKFLRNSLGYFDGSFNLLILGSLVLLLGAVPRGAFAQVTCRATVEYLVTRAEEEKPETIVYSQEEASGDDEDRVREALTRKVILVQQEAIKSCKDRHENLSGCVASKYAAVGGLLQQMQFSARAQLQSAIESDCKKQLGRCELGNAPELKCVIPTPEAKEPSEPVESAAEKKAGKK